MHHVPPGGRAVVVDHTQLPSAVTGTASAHAWLLSVWVPVALGALTLALLATVAVRVRRRRRWWTHVPWSLAALASLVLCVLAGVNSYAGYLPTGSALEHFAAGDDQVPLGTVHAGSAQTVLLHTGLASGVQPGRWSEEVEHLSDPALDISSRTVLVALPPGYATSGLRYPVVYLFNGYPGRPSDWFVSGQATATVDALTARALAPQVILVAPDVNGSWLHDSETLDQVHGPQVETWVSRDVVGWVDAHLRTRVDRADRMLAGMSSGGFAALNLGLQHQDEFGVVAGFEPYGDPGAVTGRLLGGRTALLHADSPDWYVPTMPMTWRSAFFLDVGSRSAKDVARVRGLAQLLLDRGQRVDFRIETGRGSTHTWAEAAQGFPYAMTFAAQSLGSPTFDTAVTPGAFPTTARTTVSFGLSKDAELDFLLRHHHLHPSASPTP